MLASKLVDNYMICGQMLNIIIMYFIAVTRLECLLRRQEREREDKRRRKEEQLLSGGHGNHRSAPMHSESTN